MIAHAEGLLTLAPHTSGERPGVTRALVGDGCRVVMFTFAAGQVLREHAAAFPILVQALEGRLTFTAGAETIVLEPGTVANLPAHVRHEVRAESDAVLQLVMLDPRARSSFADQVLAESAAWVWVPPDAVDETADDHRLTLYPGWASVAWSTTRDLPALIDDVERRAREAGRSSVRWWTSDRTRPADTAAVLAARGYRLAETVDVLARPIDHTEDFAALLDVPDDIELRPADEEATLRLAGEVDASVFGWDPPTDAQIAAELASDTTTRWLALADGRPVGSAGMTLAGPALRLWGGAVVEDARGRGVYRALLAERLRTGAEDGAVFALVKGRIQTSAPVLRRAGFTTFGTEHCFERTL